MTGYTISGALKEIADGSCSRIDLSNCELNDDDVERLCGALADNSTVTFLSLSGNGIGAEAAKFIGHMLKSNKGITTLDLNVNNIGDDGALFLAQVSRSQPLCRSIAAWPDGWAAALLEVGFFGAPLEQCNYLGVWLHQKPIFCYARGIIVV